jgi:hypothetical protein
VVRCGNRPSTTWTCSSKFSKAAGSVGRDREPAETDAAHHLAGEPAEPLIDPALDRFAESHALGGLQRDRRELDAARRPPFEVLLNRKGEAKVRHRAGVDRGAREQRRGHHNAQPEHGSETARRAKLAERKRDERSHGAMKA